jgi:hypothetical protein
MWLHMINMQEFARRLSTLGSKAYTSDDIVDLAIAADVRISSELEIDDALAQRLLDRVSPPVPVTGAQIAASEWPPPTSSRPAAPPVAFSRRCRRPQGPAGPLPRLGTGTFRTAAGWFPATRQVNPRVPGQDPGRHHYACFF